MFFSRLKLAAFFIAFLGLSVCLPMASVHAEEHGGGGGGGEHGGGGGEGGGEKAKKPSGDVSGGRFAGDPIYVHLQPIFIPIVTDSGAEQIVTILVDLKVKDMNTADKIQDSMPRVRDALMQSLYGGLGSGSLRRGKIVDVAKIKQKISGAMANLMGEEIVEEVLIQGIAQRKL